MAVRVALTLPSKLALAAGDPLAAMVLGALAGRDGLI